MASRTTDFRDDVRDIAGRRIDDVQDTTGEGVGVSPIDFEFKLPILVTDHGITL